MRNLPLCLLVFIPISVALVAARTFLEEYGELRESLIKKSKYNFKVRPANETVVNITLDLTTLNKLDIGSQTLTTTFLLYMSWIDERLTWPSTTEIECLIYSIKEIWTPNLVITNYVNDFGLIGIYDDGPVPLRVSYEGRVVWSLRIATTTTCQADITYYPYDTQTCQLEVMEWAHPINEVELHPEGIVRGSFQSDGEWELKDASLETFGEIGAHNSTYEKIKYTFHFKRQFQWYIPLLMVPLGVLSLLMPGVFVVPEETGEKMSYSLTVMLSFTVISSFLFETLPKVSDTYSLLGVYVSATMTSGAFMIVLSLKFLYCSYPAKDDNKANMKKFEINAFYLFFGMMLNYITCFLSILYHPNDMASLLGIMIGVSIAGSPIMGLIVYFCCFVIDKVCQCVSKIHSRVSQHCCCGCNESSNSTPQNSPQGNSAQQNSPQGNSAQQNSPQGNSAQQNGTQGNSAQQNSTQGKSTQGNSTQENCSQTNL